MAKLPLQEIGLEDACRYYAAYIATLVEMLVENDLLDVGELDRRLNGKIAEMDQHAAESRDRKSSE